MEGVLLQLEGFAYLIQGLRSPWEAISGKECFSCSAFIPEQRKRKAETNMFSEASEQSLNSKHPPLMENSQIALWDAGRGG